MNEPNYYRIKFNGLPFEVYEYGTDAIEAVAIARNDLELAGLDTETPLNLGGATARKAMLDEWECDSFTIAGHKAHAH